MAFLDALKESRRELIPDELKSSYDSFNKAVGNYSDSQRSARSARSGSGNQLSQEEIKEQAKQQARQQISPVNKLNNRINEARTSGTIDAPSILDLESARENLTDEPSDQDENRSRLIPSIADARMGVEAMSGNSMSNPNNVQQTQQQLVEDTENDSGRNFFNERFNQNWLQDFQNSPEIGNLIGNGSPFDPSTWAFINGSQEDRAKADNAPNRFKPLEVSDQETIDRFNTWVDNNQILGPVLQTGEFRNSLLDDGSMTPETLRSSDMTGDQYIRYQQELGTGGRPIEEINPNGVYNKQEEFSYYGFQPIIQDEDQLRSMSADSVFQGGNKLVNKFSDIREDNRGDWFINNVQQEDGSILNNLNGDYFRNNIGTYFNNVVGPQRNTMDQNRFIGQDQLTEDIINDPNYSKQALKGLILSFDGVEYNYPGAAGYDIDEDQLAEFQRTGDYTLPITIYLTDRNGNTYYQENGEPVSIEFESVNEYNDVMDANGLRTDVQESFDPDDYIVQAVRIDPFVMEDGTEVPYRTAMMLASDEGGTYDYGPFNINKPRDEVTPFIEYDDGNWNFSMEDVVPGMIDIALNSAPYMAPVQVMAPLTASNMYQAAKGIDARSLDNGMYEQVAENPTWDQYLSNVGGELLIPLSEHLMGVGAGAAGRKTLFDRLAPRLTERMNRSAAAPLLNLGRSTLGEGWEEVLQNPIEEAQQSGIRGMYANQLDDKFGQPDFDATNHPRLDYNTPLSQRIGNAVTGLPNDFLAGAMMGGAFNAPHVPGAVSQTAKNRNAAWRAAGLDPYQQPNYLERQQKNAQVSDEQLEELRMRGLL